MQTRKLGNSDLSITPIGFGAWAIGGSGWAFAWGAQDDADSIAAIQEAIDLGVNWIDTAPVYGLGHSEEVVGKALKQLKTKPYVFTKCGRVWDENRQIGKRLKRASVRQECEDSLRRLGIDVIDLYQMHWPEPDEDIEEGFSEMLALQREGKVRWVGVSNYSVEQMQRVSKLGPITSLQPPYHMLRRDIESAILPHAGANNIGVIGYSPMASGLLSGAMTRERIAAMPDDDWRKSKNQYYQEPGLTRTLQLVELLREIGARHNKSPGEVAIAWTLRRPEVTAAIVGARKPGQVTGIIGAAEWRLTGEELSQIEKAIV